jgi:transposase-like protein
MTKMQGSFYEKYFFVCFPERKSFTYLEEGFEDSIEFCSFPELGSRKISSINTRKRLNNEIRRRSSVLEGRVLIPIYGL